MKDQRITYVCLRPEHHRHRKPEPAFTTYRECCAYCPANAPEGHLWSVVPEVTLETLATLGWVRGGSNQKDDGKVEPERELAGATR